MHPWRRAALVVLLFVPGVAPQKVVQTSFSSWIGGGRCSSKATGVNDYFGRFQVSTKGPLGQVWSSPTNAEISGESRVASVADLDLQTDICTQVLHCRNDNVRTLLLSEIAARGLEVNVSSRVTKSEWRVRLACDEQCNGGPWVRSSACRVAAAVFYFYPGAYSLFPPVETCDAAPSGQFTTFCPIWGAIFALPLSNFTQIGGEIRFVFCVLFCCVVLPVCLCRSL
jgi:hypothetical protein